MFASTLPKAGPPLTETLRREQCPTCGRLILRALDHVPAGLDVRVDAYPLPDARWEALARLDGRATYDVVMVWNRRILVARDTPELILQRRHPVVAVHGCGARLPTGVQPIEPTASVFPRARVDGPPPF